MPDLTLYKDDVENMVHLLRHLGATRLVALLEDRLQQNLHPIRKYKPDQSDRDALAVARLSVRITQASDRTWSWSDGAVGNAGFDTEYHAARDALAEDASTMQWHDVPCPKCGAAKGFRCKNKRGAIASEPHQPRLRYAADRRNTALAEQARAALVEDGGGRHPDPFAGL